MVILGGDNIDGVPLSVDSDDNRDVLINVLPREFRRIVRVACYQVKGKCRVDKTGPVRLKDVLVRLHVLVPDAESMEIHGDAPDIRDRARPHPSVLPRGAQPYDRGERAVAGDPSERDFEAFRLG